MDPAHATEWERFSDGKDRAQALWRGGDYDAFTQTFVSSDKEEFAAALEAAQGAQVLDVACGTGASSIPLARRGFVVTGLDLSPDALAVARHRADAQDLRIRFDQGFLEELPYPDASFDAATSMYGVIFSSAPELAVAEIARVLKPGARLALATWTRRSFSARTNDAFASYRPPAPMDAPSPFDWGDADTVRARLRPHFDGIETRTMPVTWTVDAPPAEAARRFIDTVGPVNMLYNALQDTQQSSFLNDFERLWADHDRSTEAGRTVVHNECLVITALRSDRAVVGSRPKQREPGDLHIVPATESDLREIADLLNRAYRGVGSDAGWTTEAELIAGQRISEATLRQEFSEKPQATLLIWRPEAEIEGCAWLTPEGSDVWSLGSFAVAPRRQNGGFGRSLLRSVEGWAAARGGRTMEMTVVEARTPLIDWYLRRGYRSTGRFEPWPEADTRFGTPVVSDLRFVVMDKRLGPA